MTLEIGIVFAILAISLVLFVTEKLRMDVVALLVLSTLAITGLVTPTEALAGFSNSAVITVWAVFMLSGGLSRTGVANVIGRYMLHLAGRGQVRIIFVIMVTSGVLSAFMNNIGVAALLLPVVMDIARQTGNPPSRLLMPLAYGSLLGGLTTLIGTPPNILVSQQLDQAGMESFSLFDFVPLGSLVMLGGIAFVALVGRKLLPERDPRDATEARAGLQLAERYAEEQMFVMQPAQGSMLVGKTLAESRLGAALDLNVVAIERDGTTRLAPEPDRILRADDRLFVQGRLDRFNQLNAWREIVIEGRDPELERRVRPEVARALVTIEKGSPLDGLTLFEADLRRSHGLWVLAIQRGDTIHQVDLPRFELGVGDRLLVEARPDRLTHLQPALGLGIPQRLADGRLPGFESHERVFVVRVPAEAQLVGSTLGGSRLGDALGLRILGLEHDGELEALPEMERRISANDRLLLAGERKDLYVLRGLQQLEVVGERPIQPAELESETIGMAEAILSPSTQLAGKSLRQLDFRDRYGLRVLAIMRGGEAIKDNLAAEPLRLGDALLLLGERDKLSLLGRDRDFVVLTQTAQEPRRTQLAPVAVAIMAAVLIPVLFNWLPIAISAVAGATLMVVTRCLTMEEAYQAVEWRAIFLISGMLPLGTAMEQTGAASLVAEQVLAVAGPLGPYGAVAGLYLVTALATSIVPTAALVLLMSPIVLKTSAEMGVSPQAMMMAVAVAASASFTSPISHPANVLVMGPGGYRFVDYLKVGVPLTILIFVIVMIALPFIWPL